MGDYRTVLFLHVGMTVIRCAHAWAVHTPCIQRAQDCRLRGVRPFTAAEQRCRPVIRSAGPAAAEGAAGTVTQEGPRCYLEPAGDGEGLVEICLTEGKLDIGIADSDYYFTAFSGSFRPHRYVKRERSDHQGGTLPTHPASAMCSVRAAAEARGVCQERGSRPDGR